MNKLITNTASILGGLFLTLQLTACSDQSTGTQDLAVYNLLPLQVGNQWTFQRTYYDTLGNSISTYPPESVLIKADTTIDGFRWFYHDYLGHLLAYRNTENGTLTRLVSPNTDGKSLLLYKQPALVGEAYAFPIVYFSGNSAWLDESRYRCTFIASNVTVSVPAGTFRCFQFRVTRQDSDGWWDEFLSPDFGWIRKDAFSRRRPGGGFYLDNSLQATRIVILP